MEDNEKKSSLGGNIAGKFMGGRMGDTTEIASDLREGKAGAAAMKAAELGVNAALTATGFGGVALKAARMAGLPVDKIIVVSIIFLVLFFVLIVLAGGYAFVNKWSLLWDGFWSLFS